MERRAYNRYPINSNVKVLAEDPMTKDIFNGQGEIADISLGGISLYLDTCLPADTNVDLQTDLSTINQVISTKARVKWTRPNSKSNRFKHGLQFLDPNLDILREALREINIRNIESFFDSPLPDHIRKNYEDTWIAKKLNQKEIMNCVDFLPPFLKVDKFVLLDIDHNGSPTQDRGISTGIVTLEDTKGHYNNTIFLALCGWLMASTASIHLAVLEPKTVPQVIEANGVRPLLSLNHKKHVWKPSPEGTRFFVESHILKQKLRLAIVTTTITFGNVLFGVVDELKLIIDTRESIFNAVTFPQWNWNNAESE